MRSQNRSAARRCAAIPPTTPASAPTDIPLADAAALVLEAVVEVVEDVDDLRQLLIRVADLRVADLRVADLRVADLRVADLRVADLRVADLRVADLRVADLRG